MDLDSGLVALNKNIDVVNIYSHVPPGREVEIYIENQYIIPLKKARIIEQLENESPSPRTNAVVKCTPTIYCDRWK